MATKITSDIDFYHNSYLFKVGSLGILVLMLFIISYKNIDNDNLIPFKAYFNYVEGLNIGSKVVLSGVKIGEIKDIEIDNNQVLVSGSIISSYDIPEDSIAVIRSNGIFGKKSLLIEPGFGDAMEKEIYIFTNFKDSYSVDMFMRYLNNINE